MFTLNSKLFKILWLFTNKPFVKDSLLLVSETTWNYQICTDTENLIAMQSLGSFQTFQIFQLKIFERQFYFQSFYIKLPKTAQILHVYWVISGTHSTFLCSFGNP